MYPQRGFLGSMEFTGNIIGYASSVVSVQPMCMRNLMDHLTVDRLWLHVHPIRLVLADTTLRAMYWRSRPLPREFRDARVASVALTSRS